MTPRNRLLSEPVAFWGQGWFWCVLALASLLPFIVAPLPMMPDFFSHTARYHVMNHGADSAFLPRYYRFQWALIGNLGIDLVMVPLGAIWPTETAARIAVASIPVLTIAGIYAVARASWGRIEAPALLALPFVYSFTFLYGFVNYHFAVALALLGFAAWIKLAPRRAWLRWLVFAPLAMAVWVARFPARSGRHRRVRCRLPSRCFSRCFGAPARQANRIHIFWLRKFIGYSGCCVRKTG
jgi:hypothetical protein